MKIFQWLVTAYSIAAWLDTEESIQKSNSKIKKMTNEKTYSWERCCIIWEGSRYESLILIMSEWPHWNLQYTKQMINRVVPCDERKSIKNWDNYLVG
jgi:hypothetical protein